MLADRERVVGLAVWKHRGIPERPGIEEGRVLHIETVTMGVLVMVDCTVTFYDI